MSDCVAIDLAWYDGLDHREIGALALLIAHAQPALSAWPGCLPDDDVLLCEFAGFGVQLGAWRRVRKTVLAGWRRVRHPSGAVVWAHAGLCAALGAACGVDAAAPAQAAAALTAAERKAQRDMVKKRRKRAREKGEAGYVDAAGRFVRFDGMASEGLSPSGAAVPPADGGQSPGQSSRSGAENRDTASHGAREHARAREESPLAADLSPSGPPGGGGQARARARAESGSEESPQMDRSSHQTTTQTGQAQAHAHEGAGAREAAGDAEATGGRQSGENCAAEAKAAQQGEPATLSGAALDQACARVYAFWLEARAVKFEGAKAPTKDKATQLKIIRDWFDAGATEATLRDTIRMQMGTLSSAPNTIWVFHLSMAGAITEQLSLPLMQQQGNRLKLRPSLLPHAQALIAAVPNVAALNSWIGRCDLEPMAGGRVKLLAPSAFLRSVLQGKPHCEALDAVFGKGGWIVEAAGHRQQKKAGGAA